MTAWGAIRAALLLLALAPFGYYIVAIIATHRFFSKRAIPLPEDFTPPLSILKPIYGLDRETYENYASFCRQDYPEFEILFCVSDDRDPAVPVIQKIIEDFPERPIRLLIGSEPLGASDKVNKLCRMVREARHEIVLVTDSDVRVERGFLRAIAAAFSDPEVGGVTCLYRGLTDGSFAAGLEAMGNSTDFAAGVLVNWLGGKIDFMLGAIMATTKKNLAEIGGFESLADYFCDDFELGNRIAKKGHRIELSAFPVSIIYPRETLAGGFPPPGAMESEHSILASCRSSGIDFHPGLAMDDSRGAGRAVGADRARVCRGVRGAAKRDGEKRRSLGRAGRRTTREAGATAGTRRVCIRGMARELLPAANSMAR